MALIDQIKQSVPVLQPKHQLHEKDFELEPPVQLLQRSLNNEVANVSRRFENSQKSEWRALGSELKREPGPF